MSTFRARRKPVYVPPPARGSCPSGKVQFASRKQARKGARFRSLSGLSVFKCDRCEFFHLGHLPQRVRNGEIDKAAWLETKARNA
jgi:hypothetical protein